MILLKQKYARANHKAIMNKTMINVIIKQASVEHDILKYFSLL